MSDNEDTSVFLTGRKALVAALVSLALNPISIFLGYYLGQTLQRPKLSIEYVRAEPEEEKIPIADEPLKKIRRNLLVMQILDSKLPFRCDDWPREGKIDTDCIEPSIEAMNGLLDALGFEIEAVTSNLQAIEAWTPESELVVQPMIMPGVGEPLQVIARRDKATAIEILKSFTQSAESRKTELEDLRSEILRIKEEKSARTGGVVFKAGVLNSGDSDGVVFPTAHVNFGDSKLVLDRDKDESYTVIKAHSFSEIALSLDEEKTQTGAIDKWKALVLNRQQEEFTLNLTGPGSPMSLKGRLPQ